VSTDFFFCSVKLVAPDESGGAFTRTVSHRMFVRDTGAAGAGGLIVSVADFVVPPDTAEIVEFVCVVTVVVFTVKVVEFVPAATTIEEGTVAELELLDSVTMVPPVGALPVSVTFPVEELPPITLVGLSVTPLGTGALTCKLADFETPDRVPVIVAVTFAATGTVDTVNVLDVVPAATVTLDGTIAIALLLERLTTAPPAGAALESVTVPVLDAPPVTVVGDKESVERFWA
jgi:hypothetical protein